MCVRVREQWCDNDVEQVSIDLRHRVTELEDENRKLKQQVGELRRVEQKVRDEEGRTDGQDSRVSVKSTIGS